MRTTIKLAKIGNSQGIRLSKQLLRRYKIEDQIDIETTSDAIILRPHCDSQLSWEATYQQMAAADEDFSDWDAVAEDGINYES